jgi:hypothetical protein
MLIGTDWNGRSGSIGTRDRVQLETLIGIAWNG